MLPRWRRVYSLCATIVVLLVYLKTSIGATTEITITDVSSDGSTFVTTVAATITLEPTTSLPTSFAPGPNMVVNLTRAASNSTTVTAQWDRPSGEVSGYRVQCSEGTADKSEIKDVDDTEASCTGDDIAGVEVNVTVIAFSDDKESVPDTVSIRANPNPVENLTESGADTSSVTANWMEPSGLVDGYNFTCSEGSESAVTEMDGDQYEASCNDIDAGDNITVYVSSVSDNVESIVRSILITAYPNGVMLTESGATTENVTVTWTAPIGFFNSYEGDCSEGSLSENLTSSSTTATCTGVTAGNVVTVTVVTVSGDKKSSNYTNVTALPNAVLNLTQKDATNSSVTVSWLDPGDIIDSYSVECSNGTSDGKLPNTSTEATCTGVTAGVLVTVTVYTVSGEKRNSANTNVRALPYRVKNLIEVDATTDTISASWQFPGGVVSKYEIFCFNGTAKPSEVYENSSDVYVSTCQDLPTPGDTYTMQVTSFSDTIPGAADTVQITAVPDSPDLQGLPSTVEIVSANWSHPDGIVDTFEVMCEPDNISRPVNRSIDAGGTTPFVAECQVDVPGALYNLSVISVSGNKTSSISVEPLRALSFELLVVENYSADAVMLKWYISGRCQDVGCEFMVIYEADGINDFEIKDGGNTTTEEIIVITDLIPGECYTFTGVESYEAGNFSRSIQQCTLPEAVGNLTVVDVTNTTVKLQWTVKDECQDGGCVWSSFKLLRDKDIDEQNIDRDRYSTFFTSLMPGQSYTFTIIVLSGDEESSPTYVIDRTKPNIVENLRLVDSSTASVKVEWDEPLDSVFDSYTISCSTGTPNPMMIPRNGTLEASCDGVTPGTIETTEVTVVSGSRSNSDTISNRVKPNTVQGLEGSTVNTTSVSVTWNPPSDPDEDSYYYTVNCSQGDAVPDNITDGATTEATCSPVTAGSLVTVIVTTFSGSESNTVSTMVRAQPNSVDALEEENATTDSVTASWQKPGGVVSEYRIECSHGNPQQAAITDDGISMKYNAMCVNILVPGTECTMTVTSISDNVRGDGHSVRITAVPIPPELIERVSTETSISVEWQKPNSFVDYYIVECSDGMESSSNITVANGTLTASCKGLEDPGDRYDISVQSQSNDKLSAAMTKSINALPDSVRLVKGPSSVDIVSATWERPDGVFDEFTVWCTPADIATPEEEEVLFDPDATSYGADCIVSIPGNLYNMTVVSSSGNQNSSSSSLPLRALPEAVKEFTVEDVTTDMVDLQWEMKDQCLNVGSCIWTSFNVSREPNFVQQSIDEDERSTSFTKLTPGEKYTFSIIVLSGEEQSSPVNVSERTIPESVDEFNVSLYSTDFVELYWTIKAMCYNSSCVWDSYNLTYTSDRNSEEQSIPPLDQNTETANVTGLIPGENYNFSIIGVSAEKGSSPVSFVQRTIPETVDKFEVVSYGTETVNLRWTTKAMCEGSQCVWDLYRISYVSFSGTVGKPLEEPMNSSSIKITDLTPGESYDFSITVYSGAEESEDKMVTQRTSPEAVETFKVVDYTDNAVNLSWTMTQKCEGGDCEWTSYEIHYNSTVKDDISDQERTATIDFLTPGEEYTFHIVVISDKESSTFTNTTQRLKPDNVGELSVPENSSHQITVEWDKPGGLVTSYNTTIVGPDNYFEYQNVTTLYVTYTGLTPGEYYDVTVCTVSFEESCIQESVERNIRTVPVAPSAPVNVSLTEQSITSVQLTFLPPNEPNGIISKYLISYTGRKSGDDTEHTDRKDIEANQPDDKLYTETFEGLRAGFTYVFSVTAENEAGPGAPAKDEITLNQMKPDESPLSPNEVAVPVSTNINSFIVYFSELTFSHCNGELTILYVIVVEVGGDEELGDSLRSYSEAQNQKRLSAYVAIVMEYPFEPSYSSCESRRKKRQTPSPVQIEIGDGTCSEDEKYCNGPLHGNREYKVKFRACNDAGCSDTVYSDPIKTDLNNLSWVLPLVFILLILICAAALFIVWKERQQPGSMTKYIKRPTKGIDNRGFEHDKPMRRQGDRRPVKLVEFGNFLEDMSRDSDYLFSEEYNDLRPVGKNQSTDAAQLEVNRVKNRFSNILPYDHTRVTLSPIDDEEGTDYINANYMLGYRSQREYVACQGPLQSTEEDMWRLVWEQGASIIVMVTQLMENGKIKCHQYWPDEGEGPVRYGDVVVNPGEVEKKELWTIRKFQITKGPHTRKITHFNFIAWPDHGVPEKPDDLIKFVRTVREYKPNDGKPTVVHCSAGVGRTGTFISLDHLMSAMEDKDEVDIFGMVRSMRMNRCMMVQTESQYIFIHQCVMALIEGSSEDDAVYENVNGGTKGYFNEALI